MAPIHILILGGDVKFLPLAKSKVRALADRVGPDGYASQKLVIEGTTIMVEVKKGIQRITMSGSGGGDVFMDSGAVNIVTVGATDPTMGETDGIMDYGTVQEDYVTLSGKIGVLLGKLKSLTNFSSVPSEDGKPTKSFKAKVVEGVRVTASEDQLASKKLCSKLVPPSLFTGKMRLWIQAQYGRELSAWPFSVSLANTPPALNARFNSTNFLFHPALCGIYSEKMPVWTGLSHITYQHWFVQIGIDGEEAYEGVTIRKMVYTAAGRELMRVQSTDPLMADDVRERVEAYALSQAVPASKATERFPMTIPARLSFGYGWHFSWSGASADIVDHRSMPYGSGFAYEATHYRLSLRKDEIGTVWTAAITQEETATWGNNKWKTVIAYPDWAESTLSIFGSTFGLKQATNAPVYCFWRRDGVAGSREEIFEMIRYSYTAPISGTRGEWISDPPYYWGMKAEGPGLPTNPGCANQGLSMGLEATRYDSITYPETATASSFSSSSEAVNVSARSRSSTGVMGTEKAATKSTFIGSGGGYPAQPIQDGPGGMPVFDEINYCPTGTYGGAHGPTTGYTPVGGTLSSYGARITWTQYAFTESVTESLASLLVIPFGDAEAVYIYGKEYSLVSNTRTTSRAMDSGTDSVSFIEYYNISDGVTSFDWYDTGAGLDSDHDVAAPVADGTVITSGGWVKVASKLISNAGVQDTTWEPSNSFFAGDPVTSVGQQLFTLTSASIADVKGEEIDLTGGYSVNTAPFVFVGWA